MAKNLKKGKNAQTVELRKLVARKNRRDGKAANLEPRVIEFPKPTALDYAVSDRIIFEVGDVRFAIKWEIEQLPPAGPVVAEHKRIARGGLQTSRGLPVSRS
jgi:hypothetical protein